MSTPAPFAAKSFFAGLFDFSFTTFITLKFLRVIYIFITAVIGLGALIFFISLASQGGAETVLGIIVAPIAALVWLIIARIYMELIALFFRIGENTSLLVSLAQAQAPGYGQPPLGGPSPYGTATPYAGPTPQDPPPSWGAPPTSE